MDGTRFDAIVGRLATVGRRGLLRGLVAALGVGLAGAAGGEVAAASCKALCRRRFRLRRDRNHCTFVCGQCRVGPDRPFCIDRSPQGDRVAVCCEERGTCCQHGCCPEGDKCCPHGCCPAFGTCCPDNRDNIMPCCGPGQPCCPSDPVGCCLAPGEACCPPLGCIDPMTDARRCGGCGKPPCGAHQECVGGKCRCRAGSVACGAVCCPPGVACFDNDCLTDCPPGARAAGGLCCAADEECRQNANGGFSSERCFGGVCDCPENHNGGSGYRFVEPCGCIRQGFECCGPGGPACNSSLDHCCPNASGGWGCRSDLYPGCD